MKKITLLIIVIFTLSRSFAHKEWVHQYMVKQAYYFLEQEFCEIPEMKNQVGLDYYGFGDNVSPWKTTHGIGVGAWREDIEDPIWGYGIFNGYSASITHFWDADQGDESKWDVPFSTVKAYNAWYKARKYLFGSEVIFFKEKATYRSLGVILGLYISYNSLIDFYKYGHGKIMAYMDINGIIQKFDPPISIDIGDIDATRRYSWQILGRVAHLLTDMSVPAHAHNDDHVCQNGDGDIYELYMGGYYGTVANEYCEKPPDDNFYFPAENWDAQTASSQGGLIDEVKANIDRTNGLNDQELIRYLFYTLNQLTDHFPSNDMEGDNLLYYGTNDYLLQRYSHLGNPPSISTGIIPDIANETFNYAIRATATLFYWFALRTGQVEVNAKSTTGLIIVNIPNATHYQYSPFEISGLENVSLGSFNFIDINEPQQTPFRTINISNPQTTIWWDGKNENGVELTSGQYLADIHLTNFTDSKHIRRTFQKYNDQSNPTQMPLNYSLQSVKKPPISCVVPDLIYSDVTFISDRTLSENIFQAAESMTFENVTIPTGSNFTFKAGEEIVLKEGTVIEAGSDVVFKIEECSGYVPAVYGPCDFPPQYVYRKGRPESASIFQTALPAQIGNSLTLDQKNNEQLKNETLQEIILNKPLWIKVSVYNTMGQKLFDVNNPQEIIEYENLYAVGVITNRYGNFPLPRGIYLLHFISEPRTEVRKVVKL